MDRHRPLLHVCGGAERRNITRHPGGKIGQTDIGVKQTLGSGLELSVFLVIDHLADRRIVNTESLRYFLQRVSVLSVGKADQAVSLLFLSNGFGNKKLIKRGTADMPLFSRNLGNILPYAKKFLHLLHECFGTEDNLPGELLPRGFGIFHPFLHEMPETPCPSQ